MTNLRSNPKSEFIPDDDENAPARRRRARRVLSVLEGDEREHLIDELAHRTTPSLDFYILSFIAGILFSLGIFFNSHALFVFGAVIAPIMNPIIGISIGIVTGSNRFFLNSFIGLLIGIGITFSIGIIAGLINGMYAPTTLNQAYISTRFSWELLSALSICTAITTWIIAQDRNMAVLPSAMIAYSLYLPSTVAGFGFGSKTLHLFPDGLVIFAAHFALACLISAITLAAMGYRPQTLFGYTIGGAFALLSIIILIGISVTGVVYVGRVTLPTYTPTITPSLTPTITPSLTPPPPTITPTLTLTPTLTATPTLTPTSTPTPVLVFVKFPDGAKVRLKPNYSSEIVEIVANGTTLHVLDKPSVDADQRIWIHVITPSGKLGWIWQALLVTTTPVP